MQQKIKSSMHKEHNQYLHPYREVKMFIMPKQKNTKWGFVLTMNYSFSDFGQSAYLENSWENLNFGQIKVWIEASQN